MTQTWLARGDPEYTVPIIEAILALSPDVNCRLCPRPLKLTEASLWGPYLVHAHCDTKAIGQGLMENER